MKRILFFLVLTLSASASLAQSAINFPIKLDTNKRSLNRYYMGFINGVLYKLPPVGLGPARPVESAGGVTTFDALAGKPTYYPSSISLVQNLQAALDAKLSAALQVITDGNQNNAIAARQATAIISQIRSLTNTPDQVLYLATAGANGNFKLDVADNSTADNGITVLVTAGGARYKRVADVLNAVEHGGAKGDNSTNDTQALQTIINVACAANNPGLNGNATPRKWNNTVLIPAGYYRVTDEIFIPGSVTIQMEQSASYGGTRIQQVTPGKHLFHIKADNDGSASGVHFIGGILKGGVAGSNPDVALIYGGDATGDGNNNSTDVDFTWFQTPETYAGNFKRGDDIHFRNCRFDVSGAHSLKFGGTATGSVVVNSTVEGCTFYANFGGAIDIQQAQGLKISGNHVYPNNSVRGTYFISAVNSLSTTNLEISNNLVEGTDVFFTTNVPLDNVKITDNSVTNAKGQVIALGGGGVMTRFQVQNNSFDGDFSGTAGGVEKSPFFGNATGFRQGLITGNIFWNKTGSGTAPIQFDVTRCEGTICRDNVTIGYGGNNSGTVEGYSQGTVLPSFNASYIGQQYLNYGVNPRTIYQAVTTGLGSSDWQMLTNVASGTATGSGDMAKSSYDPDNNGVVDNSQNSQSLGGQPPAYYATQSGLNTTTATVTSLSGTVGTHTTQIGSLSTTAGQALSGANSATASVASLSSTVGTQATQIGSVSSTAGQALTSANNAASGVSSVSASLATQGTQIGSVSATAGQALSAANSNSISVNSLSATVGSQATQIVSLSGTAGQALTTANSATTSAANNATAIATKQNSLTFATGFSVTNNVVSLTATATVYDSLYIVNGSGVTSLYKVAIGSVVSGTTATGSVYGARSLATAPEFDTTGVGYTVVNVAATESALNSAITAVGSSPNRYLKLAAGGSLAINSNGIAFNQNINNLIIDLNSTTIATGTSNRVGLVNIGSGTIRGLAIINGTIRNTATTAQAEALGYTGYGVIGVYENANIAGATYNGKYVPGFRMKNVNVTAPNLDYDGFFLNTYSPTSVGGNGVGNTQRDLVFEDNHFFSLGSAGAELLAHRHDDNDTTTADIKNLVIRRNDVRNTGLVSRKSPKFGAGFSVSGRHEVALYENNVCLNCEYSALESVAGIDVTFRNNSSTATTGNSSGVSMTPGGKNYDLMRYVTVTGNKHYTSGSGTTGRPVELFRVSRAFVQNNTGVTATGANFRTYNSLIGSLTGTAGANNWSVTGDASAVRFQPGSTNTYLQYNTLSNASSSVISEVVGVIGSSAAPTTGNFVRYNTITRGNSGVTVKQYSADNGAAITGNTITPNTPDTQP